MLYQLSYASRREPKPKQQRSPASHTNPFFFNGTIIEVTIAVLGVQGLPHRLRFTSYQHILCATKILDSQDPASNSKLSLPPLRHKEYPITTTDVRISSELEILWNPTIHERTSPDNDILPCRSYSAAIAFSGHPGSVALLRSWVFACVRAPS